MSLSLLLALATGAITYAVIALSLVALAHLSLLVGRAARRALTRQLRRARVWWEMSRPPRVDAEAMQERELLRRWAALNGDERAVVIAAADRLVLGRVAYGALDLATDARDWRAERRAELQDALIYSSIADVARARWAPREVVSPEVPISTRGGHQL